MATAANVMPAVTPDTPITVKVSIDGVHRRFRIPLRDAAPHIFTDKLRTILQVPDDKRLVLERFSDSSNSFNPLEHSNPSSYKQLYRAAKAKLKLRLRATLVGADQPAPVQPVAAATAPAIPSVLPPQADLAARMAAFCLDRAAPVVAPSSAATAWQVCCNNCDAAMDDTHYHCSICDDGDYDLCVACVEKNVVCPGDNHWLIKRTIKNGKIVHSTTERHSTSRLAEPVQQPSQPVVEAPAKPLHVPGSFTDDASAASIAVKSAPEAPSEPLRTCNSCVVQLVESQMVNCADCPDYDLCFECLKIGEHGHHPGHSFQPCNKTSKSVEAEQALRQSANGSFKRHHAICDGCNRAVYGVRHKCLDCPDWDYCAKCFAHAPSFHPGHRFVPVYDNVKGKASAKAKHFGIYCDGPLCAGQNKQSYIQGVRYKCTICHDTDFCESCEAHPNLKHNASHPLIKFKTQVSKATITTLGTTAGRTDRPTVLGDMYGFGPAAAGIPAAATAPAQLSDRKPANPDTAPAYDAHFVRETVADGTVLSSDQVFTQSWVLRNPGPLVWPTGCGVYATGGDKMLNIDPNVAASVVDITNASSTNLTTRPVRPGEEWRFTINMRTPPRAGKQISYWRAKLPNGQAFGHKLWCDVQVQSKTAADESRPVDVRGQPGASDIQRPHYMARLQQAGLMQRNMTRAARQHPNVPSVAGPSRTIPISSMADPDSRGPVCPCPVKKSPEESKEVSREVLASEPAVPKLEQEAVKVETPEVSSELSGSQMVFPTLEKESPSSSTQLVKEEPLVKTPSQPIVASVEEEVAQDFDSVTYDESDDDEDAFLTDEEYDILDASDEEIMSVGVPHQ